MNAYRISLRLRDYDAFGALHEICERYPLGLQIKKRFGNKMYQGAICSGPKILSNLKTLVWKVKYKDGDSEVLEEKEILTWVTYPFVVDETFNF